jgi:hypothetical protein
MVLFTAIEAIEKIVTDPQLFAPALFGFAVRKGRAQGRESLMKGQTFTEDLIVTSLQKGDQRLRCRPSW